MIGLKRSVLGVHSFLKLSLTAQNFTKRKPQSLNKGLFCGCLRRTMSSIPTQFLDLGSGRKVAYKYSEGDPEKPTVVFSLGIKQTMEDFKAIAAEKFCKENGVNFVRYDYEGLGESSGSLETALFGHWIEDLQNIVDKICKTPVLYVSFSMGCWISLAVAQRKRNKLHSVLFVAPVFGPFRQYYDVFYEKFSPEQREAFDDGGTILYGDFFFRRDFEEESRKHVVDFEKPIPLNVPIRMIHGKQDRYFPYKPTLKLARLFESMDVNVTLRKSGEHLMVEPQDMALLFSNLKNLLQDYPMEKNL